MSDAEQPQTTEQGPKQAVIRVYGARWAGVTKLLCTRLERLHDATVEQIDVDVEPGRAERAGVKALPTIEIEVAGETVARIVGAASVDQIEEIVKNATTPTKNG